MKRKINKQLTLLPSTIEELERLSLIYLGEKSLSRIVDYLAHREIRKRKEKEEENDDRREV